MTQARSILLTALFTAIAVGCAQTPQTVRLAPEAPDQYSVDHGKGRTVALRVVDNRLDKSRLGELQNRDAEPALVRTEQDLAYVVELAAGQTLKAYGFKPVSWDSDADRRLTVSIDHLSHMVGAALPRSVDTDVRLSATAVHGDSTMKLKAEENSDNRISHRPSNEENASFIDQAISRALGRLVSDDLTKFLARGETGG
jgi:uncharacterized lipoprotein YajG